MSTFNPTKLAYGELETTDTEIYAPVSGVVGLVHNIILHSVSETEVSGLVTLSLSGDVAYELEYLAIDTGDTVQVSHSYEGLVIPYGMSIVGSCSVSGMNYIVNGSEVVG